MASASGRYHVHRRLSLVRLTHARAEDRFRFLSEYGLYAGKQFFVASRFAEMLVAPTTVDLYHIWFCDVLIPDECFFQTVAQHHEQLGQISVNWQNIFYAEGYRVTFRESFREHRQRNELLGHF
jgi:hypothetical protein